MEMDRVVEELTFNCPCGKRITAYFGTTYKTDRLHCECGRVWKVRQPHIDNRPEDDEE